MNIHKASLSPSVALLALAVFLAAVFLPAGCGSSSSTALKDPSNKPTAAVAAGQQASIDDLLFAQGAGGERFSPDGSTVAWVASGYVPGNESQVGNLYVTRLSDLSTRPVTDFHGEAVSTVRWSPDGHTLSFITDAPVPGSDTLGAVGQAWGWDVATGALAPITSAANGVRGYGWKGAGEILYLTQDGGGSAGQHTADDTIHVSEYASTPVRLFRQDIATGATDRLTNNDDRIASILVSPDGKQVFLSRTRAAADSLGEQYYANIPIRCYLFNESDRSMRQVFKDVKQPAGGAWSPDSKTLYLLESYSPGNPGIVYTIKLRQLTPSTAAENAIDLGWERGIDDTGTLVPTSTGFVAALADGCNPKMARYTRSGNTWKREMIAGDHSGNIFSADISSDGTKICYMYSNAGKPPQLYAASLAGATISGSKRFTELNRQFDGKVLAKTETIKWTGALGDPVEGILYYPADYQPGRKYPLVMIIHGGPFGATPDAWGTDFQRWTYPYQLMSYKGAFVLDPNYHGSSSYGFEFADSLKNGKFYEYPFEDIENGISRLVDLGMVDENKLGTLGWSNGSILSNDLVANDQRFKAASCGAGGAEWISLWGPCAFGDAVVSYYFGGDPVAKPDVYKDPELAPFYKAKSVKTPVLMFIAGDDTSVPPAQTWVTYRGIQKYAQAPTDLFVFPGEPHVMQKLAHQKRKMVEEQKWFDKYLFNAK